MRRARQIAKTAAQTPAENRPGPGPRAAHPVVLCRAKLSSGNARGSPPHYGFDCGVPDVHAWFAGLSHPLPQ